MAGTSTSGKAKKKAAKGKGSRKDNESAIKSMREEFQAGDTAQKPKKSFKTLILVVVALLLVGGGAGGAWVFLLQPAEEPVEVVEEAPPVEYPKSYVPADAVHVPFVQQDGSRRRLIVYLTLEVEDRERNVANVQEAMPRLQEAFWRTLNGEPLPGADTGVIELTAVKERVREASAHILGDDVVRDVLIRNFRVVRG